MAIFLACIFFLSACGSNSDLSNNVPDKGATQKEMQSINNESQPAGSVIDDAPLEEREQDSVTDSAPGGGEKLQPAKPENNTGAEIPAAGVAPEQPQKQEDKTSNNSGTTAESKIIYLEDMAASWVFYALNQGAIYMTRLREMEAGNNVEEDITGDLHSLVISVFDKYIFNEGLPDPDIKPFDSNLMASPEFTDWVIKRAKETGALDKRLTYTRSPKLTLRAEIKDYDPASGDLKFQVFGETFTVPAEKILNAQ